MINKFVRLTTPEKQNIRDPVVAPWIAHRGKPTIFLISCFALALLTFAQEPVKKHEGTAVGKGSKGEAISEPLDEAGAVLFKKVDPTVVAIQHEQAGGSGFIVDPTGYIITNGHVVSAALSRSWYGPGVEDPTEVAKRITVVLSDERKYPARVIGHCLDPDVALIKIEVSAPLPVVELGDSDKVKVGQRSYALGMPLGLKRTLTAGIVSNVERVDLGTFTKVIQTDAPINPGNSGGPLFNEKSEVIGINTYGMWGEGLGFTIPINVAKVLKEHFLKYGHFVRATFPFFVPKELDKDFANVLGISEGILVDYVDADTPAGQSGLQNSDIIIEMNGKPVSAPNRTVLIDVIWQFTIQPIGSKIDFKVKRKTGNEYKELVISGTIVEDEPSIRYGHQIGEVKEIRYDALGLRVEQITMLSRYMNNLIRHDGVRVTNVIRGEPAEKGGVSSNDIILELNDIRVKNTEEFQKELDKLLIGKPKYIRVLVQRRQDIVKTVIKPNYDLKDKKVALIVPEQSVEYFERIRRYFIMNGATVNVVGAVKKVKADEKEISVDVLLNDLDISDLHGLIFLSGGGVESYWNNEKIHQIVKSANQDKKILGAIGAAAPILIYSDEKLLEKKITCDKENAKTMTDKKANYTGNEIESDENIVSTTGFNKETIDGFLAKIKSPIKDFSLKQTKD